MFGYKVIRQYEHGIVLRWGKVQDKIRQCPRQRRLLLPAAPPIIGTG